MKLLIIYGVILAILGPIWVIGLWKSIDESQRISRPFWDWLRGDDSLF